MRQPDRTIGVGGALSWKGLVETRIRGHWKTGVPTSAARVSPADASREVSRSSRTVIASIGERRRHPCVGWVRPEVLSKVERRRGHVTRRLGQALNRDTARSALNLLRSPPLLYLLPHPTLHYGDGFYSLHVSPQLFDFARLLRTRTYSLRPTMRQDAPR